MQNPFSQLETQLEEIKSLLQELKDQPVQSKEPEEFIRGIHGLANYMKISPSKAQQIKNMGLIPHFQSGRTVIFKSSDVKETIVKLNHQRRK